MEEKCCKCGREAYLNEEKQCFECDESISGKRKILKKPKKVYRKVAMLVTIMLMVVNIIWSYELLIRCDVVDLWVIYVIIAGIITIYRFGAFLTKGKPEDEADTILGRYPCWQEPIINMGIKVAGALLFHLTDRVRAGDSELLRILSVIVLFMVAWLVAAVIGCILVEKKYMNYIHGIIWKIESEISDIPVGNKFDIKPIMSIDEEQVFYNKVLDNVANLREADSVKDELRRVVNERGREVYVNNDIKYLYCQVLNACLKETYVFDDNGNWVNNLQSDLDAGLYDILDRTIIHDKQYVTKKRFELKSRINSDIAANLQHFFKEDQMLRSLLQEFKKELISVSLGYGGENKMNKELKPYEGQIIALSNIRLEVEGESIENDFILLTPYGIYVLEVKNIGSGGSYNLHIEKDGRWNKVYGRRKETMNSPVHQNERHILYLEKFINNKLGRKLDDYLRVQGIVVIANDRVDIHNESENTVIRYQEVVPYIRKRNIVMKEEEMKSIANIISAESKPPKKYGIQNYMYVYPYLRHWENQYSQWKEGILGLIDYAEKFLETSK